MRHEFGKTIADIVNQDKRVYVIVGDIGYGVFDKLREENPDHFLNLGISEQAMIGVSAGLAMEGLKPFVYTITPFLLERPYEQIKLDIVQQNLPVVLVGYADYPDAGPTHQIKDAKGLCKILGLNYIKPKNSKQTAKATLKAYSSNKPYFIDLKRDKSKR